jgi:transcriptional regulator with XRE-family HTH domain
MRSCGALLRRLRTFLGLSQHEVARAAGLSQATVSRLEMGRGISTPFVVVLQVTLTLLNALRALDPSAMSDDLRDLLDLRRSLAPLLDGEEIATPPLTNPDVEELVRLHATVQGESRTLFLDAVRALAAALSDGHADGPTSAELPLLDR